MPDTIEGIQNRFSQQWVLLGKRRSKEVHLTVADGYTPVQGKSVPEKCIHHDRQDSKWYVKVVYSPKICVLLNSLEMQCVAVSDCGGGEGLMIDAISELVRESLS